MPSTPTYKPGSTARDWTDSIKYLGVTIQPELKRHQAEKTLRH